jgi:glycosyltransferase involved in cell wall biosynthesis
MENPSQAVDFSLIIACYNDAPHLYDHSVQLFHFLSKSKYTFEFIFVDDCSKDHTKSEIFRADTFLKKMGICSQTIFKSKNEGRGKAICDASELCTGRFFGFIDIDLEPLMDGLMPMLMMLENAQADLVVGRRSIANAEAKPIRVICSYVYRWIAHFALPLPISDTECGLKVFNRQKVLPVMRKCIDPHWFWDTEIVHRALIGGLQVKEHWIVFFEDRNKQSTVRLIPDIWKYLKAIRKHKRSLRNL